MNAFAPLAGLSVRTADLGEAQELRRIDAFVSGEAEAGLFHRPQWSLAVERGCRQRSHYLIVETKAGDIAGVLPLNEIRSPLFGSALVSAGFGVGGGIVARTPAAAQALADHAWQLAQQLGCPTAELRGGKAPQGWEVKEGIYAGFARALPSGDEAILKAIPRKQRAEVRRALGFSLEVTVGRAAEDGAAHYRVYSESVRNLGTPVFPKFLFEAMLGAFGENADVLTVRKDGRPVASVLSFYFKGVVYPYWGGGTAEARSLRANELMYYELMRHAAGRGCTRFDFGRSKLGTGAYAFKKNWGFEPEPLTYAMRGEGRETNPLSPKYRLQIALWQKLPLWLSNRIGPPIACGLG
jgi:FemAB-related protein (PEP-CTERM system-associated)